MDGLLGPYVRPPLQFYGLGTLLCAAYSPEGNHILTGGGARAFLWDAQTGKVVRVFYGHTRYVRSVAFSPDGTKVLTGSADETAQLWQIAGAPTTPTVVRTADKVIIVAGGRNFAGNSIVRETQALADKASSVCLFRSYQRSEIRYLSAFDDPDRDAPATIQTLWSAIDSWASDAARLVVYLVDHGSWNPQTNNWHFKINPTQTISARELDRHLDDLQSQTGCEVILVVDCCYAGGFVQQTTGTRRVVLAATTPQNLGAFLPPVGTGSFSDFFFSYAMLGNCLEDCFKWTRDYFAAMQPPWGQLPWMDDDGDGDSDKWDGKLARLEALGRNPKPGIVAPTILDVAATQSVYVRDPVDLWARLGEDVIIREVWAIVVPARAQYAAGQPVTNVTRVNLTFNSTLNHWQATFVPRLEHSGQCMVTYFAVGEEPPPLSQRLLATPRSSGLRVLGPTATHIPWPLLK